MFSGQIIDESCHWRTQAKRYQETSLFCGPNFSLPLLLYFFFFSFSIERPTPIIYYQDRDTYSYTKIVNSFFKSQSITHFETTWNSLSDVLLDQRKESKDKFVKKWLFRKIIVISLMWSIWWNIIQWLCFVTRSVNRDESLCSWWSFKSSCLPTRIKFLFTTANNTLAKRTSSFRTILRTTYHGNLYCHLFSLFEVYPPDGTSSTPMTTLFCVVSFPFIRTVLHENGQEERRERRRERTSEGDKSLDFSWCLILSSRLSISDEVHMSMISKKDPQNFLSFLPTTNERVILSFFLSKAE